MNCANCTHPIDWHQDRAIRPCGAEKCGCAGWTNEDTTCPPAPSALTPTPIVRGFSAAPRIARTVAASAGSAWRNYAGRTDAA